MSDKLLLVCGFSIFSAICFHIFGMSGSEATRYSLCNDPDSHSIQIQKLDIRPQPLVLPGAMTVDIAFNATQDVVGPIALTVAVAERQTSGDPWEDVPCESFGVQWCELDDLCQLLQTMPNGTCPHDVESAGLDCKCPLPAGQYSFPNLQFDLLLMSSDQEIRVQVHLTSHETVVTCIQLDLATQSLFSFK